VRAAQCSSSQTHLAKRAFTKQLSGLYALHVLHAAVAADRKRAAHRLNALCKSINNQPQTTGTEQAC
jgi:hypothetical protein